MRVKFLVSFLVAVSLLLNIQPTTIFASFTDTNGHEHAQAIDQLAEMGIVKGYSDGAFQPQTALYRKNVVQFLGRWMLQNGIVLPEDATQYARFDDVSMKSTELLQLSSLMQEEGIFTGTKGLLKGDDVMQRQEMAVALVRTMNTMYDIDLIADYKEQQFQTTITDIHKADSDKQEAIIALQYAGITQTTTFNPTSTLNRGQFAAFLARTMAYKASLPQEDVAAAAPETVDLTGAQAIVPVAGAPLYASLNGKNAIATYGEQSLRFPIQSVANGAYFAIEMGSERYYVPAKYVTTSTEPVETVTHTPIGTVLTNRSFTILDYNKQPIVRGFRETKMDVLAVENGYYVVKMPAGKALLAMTDAQVVAHQALVLVQDAKLTKTVGTTSTVIGLFKQGHVFTNFKKNGDQYTLTVGNTTYTMNGVAINTDAVSEHETYAKGAYPTDITAETTAVVTSKSGRVIGTIDRGQKVTLLNKTASMGIIEFAGARGYIDLSQWLHTNIVTPNRNISHTEMTYQLQLFNLLYPEFTELVSIGNSVEGRPIYALRVGNGAKEILMDGSLHAREHMTTNVLMEMIDEYAGAYVRNTKFSNIDVRKTLNTTKIWFVPMMNPDGVTLVQGGLNAITSKASVKKLAGSAALTSWKANIRGVDLNRNFEGGWKQKSTGPKPASENFKGYSVFSEPESRALRDFVAKHQFKAYISYHSSGQVIYWFHYPNAGNTVRDKAFAQKMGNITGYSLMAPIYLPGSGASTDWFMSTYKKPALTMEIAPYAGKAPVSHKQWASVWQKNKTIGLVGAQTATNY